MAREIEASKTYLRPSNKMARGFGTSEKLRVDNRSRTVLYAIRESLIDEG